MVGIIKVGSMDAMDWRPWSSNPVIMLVLMMRAQGWKHSQMDWVGLRKQYDYTQELVDVPETD